MAEATPLHGASTQRAPAIPEDPRAVDHRRARLRRRLGVDHRRDAAEHRGRAARRHSRAAQGAPAQPRARLRDRRRLPQVLVSRRRRQARAVRPRRRGIDPEREDQDRGLLGRARHRPGDRPADHDQRVDRPAGAEGRGPWWPSAPARPTAASTRWPAIRPAAMGLADYLGWSWRSKAGIPIVNVPGCPVQPDNFMETLLYLLYQAAGLAPMIPLDDALRPTWLFGKTVHEGCDRAGYYEQADFATEYGSPKCIVKLGCWGPVVQLQRAEARLDGRHRRLPQRRRHLHRLHHARLPRQVHAVHGRAARRPRVDRRRRALRQARSRRCARSPTPRSTRSRSGGMHVPS